MCDEKKQKHLLHDFLAIFSHDKLPDKVAVAQLTNPST